MLKGVPGIISPDLMHVMMRMGHGDEIVLGDANFPTETMGNIIVRQDGINICELLDAMLKFFPLDNSLPRPVILMQPNNGFETPEVWAEYKKIIDSYEDNAEWELLPRFDFYVRSRSCFAAVATGEKTRFGNIILRKGVV